MFTWAVSLQKNTQFQVGKPASELKTNIVVHKQMGQWLEPEIPGAVKISEATSCGSVQQRVRFIKAAIVIWEIIPALIK